MSSLIYLLILSFNVWSDDLSGPHQGLIKSVGPYNVELIWQKDLSLKVYLLDPESKNPIVKSSEVEVFIKSGNTESQLSCVVKEDLFFECKQSGKTFKKGELAIASKRDGIRADEIKIKVPFEMAKIEKAPEKIENTEKK